MTAYAAFFAPLIASYAFYRLWLWSDAHNDSDNPANRHRPL